MPQLIDRIRLLAKSLVQPNTAINKWTMSLCTRLLVFYQVRGSRLIVAPRWPSEVVLVLSVADVAHDERAVDDVVLEQQGHGDEGEVEEEHDEGQAHVHFPFEAGDGDDDEDQHHEEDDDGAGHAAAAHFHGTEDQRGQEPRHRKAAMAKRGI